MRHLLKKRHGSRIFFTKPEMLTSHLFTTTTVTTGGAALLLGTLPSLSWLYLLPVSLVVGDMLWRNGRLLQRPSPAHARSLFLSSNLFLLVLLVAICLDAVVSL
jgi:heme O synthase-like polyprenyltransferase